MHRAMHRILHHDCTDRPARAPSARLEAQRLQGEAKKALAEAEALKLQARLEDLTVWEMKKVKQSRKGCKTYTYWMASWREGGYMRNVHLGSARKMDAEAARQRMCRCAFIPSELSTLQHNWQRYDNKIWGDLTCNFKHNSNGKKFKDSCRYLQLLLFLSNAKATKAKTFSLVTSINYHRGII
jgi:hypothetical protein